MFGVFYYQTFLNKSKDIHELYSIYVARLDFKKKKYWEKREL